MKQTQGAKFLILFGLPFLGVGIGTGFFSLRSVVRAQAMLSWQETPALVQSCELKRESDSDGGTTYRVEAKYVYEVGDKRYTGTRVSLHSGSDNVGDFQHRLYAALNESMTLKRPTRCWVNPQKPEDAVLDRTLRIEMIAFFQVFMLAFGGAGLAVIFAGLSMRVRRMRAEAADGLIRMRGASMHRVLTAIAVLWNGYSGWLLWTLHRVLAPAPLPCYLWVLAVIGVLLAGVAIYRFARFRRYGVSVFALSPAPGVVGGPVSGQIRVPARVEAAEGFELRLQCYQRYTSTSDGESSTSTELRWEDSRHAVVGLAYGEETVVPVRFAVPFDQPETTADGGDGYFWRLKATARTAGIDYTAEFDVPVKKSAQSSAGYVESQRFDPDRTDENAAGLVRRMSLRLEARPDGGFELVFPAARATGIIVFLVPFTAAWSGICYVLWFVAHAPLLFPIVFSLFDALLLLIVFNALLVSRGIVIDRSRRECVVWSRLFGMTIRARRMPLGEVLDVHCSRSGSSGNSVYYRIVLRRKAGWPSTLTVADNLQGLNDVERLARLLSDGLRTEFRLQSH